MSGRQILLQFVKERKCSYSAGIALLILSTVAASLLPKVLGHITDGLNRGDMLRIEILKNIGLMMLIALSVFGLKFTWRYFLIGNARSVECYMRERLFRHLQTLPVTFYNNRKTGDLVAYAINDIQAVRRTMAFGTVAVLEGVAINSVSIFFMARTIHPILTLLALAPLPVVVFILVKLRLTIRRRFDRVQKAFAEISDKVQENISGIRVIKAFAQEAEETAAFDQYNRRRVDTQMHLTKVSALLGPYTQVCFGASFMLFILYGSGLVTRGAISLGDYVAFNAYMLMIIGPITNIARIIEVWQQGIASIRRLDGIFSVSGEVVSEEPVPEQPILGSIEIKDLNFTYPGSKRRALKDISLSVIEGKTLGILGKTGSGKTTLVSLLLRLYPVERGKIFIDNQDISDYSLEQLRECIGFVPQDHFLFSTTIRENIQFFRDGYTEEEVALAAQLSGVYDNIQDFPEGFNTMVGERGVTLSGGQKQRISIARAIIKNPSILILDDSLSAVDTKTEEEILSNIEDLLATRRGILISHRVSTVKHADEIVYMDRGRIAERGTHEELMELKGLYYTLYHAQLNQITVNEEGVPAV